MRVFDVVFAGLVLVLSAPVVLAAMLAIRLESPARRSFGSAAWVATAASSCS